MRGIGERERFHLFTEQIKEINSLISANLFFLEKLEEVLFRTAGFINASSGIVKVTFKNTTYLHTFGLDTELHQDLKASDFATQFKQTESDQIDDYILCPIQIHSEIVGHLLFIDKETRKGTSTFEHIDFSLITVIAQQIGLALERLEYIMIQKELFDMNVSILNSTSSAIVATDENLNIILTNLKAEQWFNFKQSKSLNLLENLPINSQVRNFITDFIEKKEAMAADSLVLSAQNPRLLKTYASPIYNRTEHQQTEGYIFSFDDVTELKKLKDTFSRYVSKDVLNHLLHHKGNLRLGGFKRSCTILFSDIRGFTSYSEQNEAEEVVETLNQYFNMMMSCINDEFGEVDKFVGDEIMVVFNDIEGKDHPNIRAVRASIAMKQSLEVFNQMREELDLEQLYFGIGINYGEVICGNIGSFDRMDYTVIGDNVNIASRLCSIARKDEILISSQVAEGLPSAFKVEELKPFAVKGKSNQIKVFRVNN